MVRHIPESRAARWHRFPHLQKYFAALEPSKDPMDGWPGETERREREQEAEKSLHQLLLPFLQFERLDQPAPDPADLKSLHNELEMLARMCDHFAGMHDSSGRQLRTMRREVLAKIETWVSRV